MIRERRELVGVSQRELARRTGIAQARLSRMEAGGLKPSSGDLALIELALADSARSPVAEQKIEAPREPERAPAAVLSPRRIRRVFVCRKCRRRLFLGPDKPWDFVPSCEEHGRMVRQANRPYKGQSTEPPSELGVPEPGEWVEIGKAVGGLRASDQRPSYWI